MSEPPGKPAHLAHPLPQEPLRLMIASLSVCLGSDVPTPSTLGNTLPSKELPAAFVFGAFSGCCKVSWWKFCIVKFSIVVVVGTDYKCIVIVNWGIVTPAASVARRALLDASRSHVMAWSKVTWLYKLHGLHGVSGEFSNPVCTPRSLVLWTSSARWSTAWQSLLCSFDGTHSFLKIFTPNYLCLIRNANKVLYLNYLSPWWRIGQD